MGSTGNTIEGDTSMSELSVDMNLRLFPPGYEHNPSCSVQDSSDDAGFADSLKGDMHLMKEDNLFLDYLYGKDVIVDETDELVASKLFEIEREMDKLSDDLKKGYFDALVEEIRQKTHYVRSKKVLLMFLRSERFDAPKAALRMALFFKFKLDLYGQHKLPHPIREADLNEADKKVLEAGTPFFCGKDYKGRSVIMYNRNRLKALGLLNSHFMKNILRVGLYKTMCAVEDNGESQKKGFIGIRFNMVQKFSYSLKDYSLLFRSNIKMFTQALPIRWVGAHDCADNSIANTCLTWSRMAFMPKDRRDIIKVHNFSSVAECFSMLSSFGINVENLPVTSTGETKAEALLNEFKMPCKIDDEVHLQRKNQGEKTSMSISVDDDSKSTYQDLFSEIDVDCDIPNLDHSLSDVDFDDYLFEEPVANNMNNRCKVGRKAGINVEVHNLPAPQTKVTKDNEVNGQLIEGRKSPNREDIKNPPILIDDTIADKKDQQISLPKVVQKESASGVSVQSSIQQKGSSKRSTCKSRCLKDDQLPKMMFEILESNRFPDAIWWSQSGTSFLMRKKMFTESILETQLEGIMFNSFLRKLRNCGFQRVPTKGDGKSQETLEYQHRLFQKNSPELLKNWDNKGGEDQSSKKEKLPLTLMKILSSNDEASRAAMWWVCNGKAFAIDERKFANGVLDNHFQGVKLGSFYRMLSRWGFKRLHKEEERTSNAKIFQNALFHVHSQLLPELLENWAYLDGLSQMSTPTARVFFKKLHKVLMNKETQHAIWWDDNGGSFIIHKENFTRDVLPKAYNGVSLYSFRRSLKRWGFEKLADSDKNVLTFHHPYFKKNSPGLTTKVRRVKCASKPK